MLAETGPVTRIRSRNTSRSARACTAATTALRFRRAIRDCGSAYRRTAAAATDGDAFGTSSRGRCAFGTTRYSAIRLRSPSSSRAVRHGCG